MQLPTQLAYEVHTQRVNVLLSRHREGLRAQPREGFVGKVGIRQRRKQITRTRPAQHKGAALQSSIDKFQRTIGRKRFLQQIMVETLGGT